MIAVRYSDHENYSDNENDNGYTTTIARKGEMMVMRAKEKGERYT
jgi:hypothetical protein